MTRKELVDFYLRKLKTPLANKNILPQITERIGPLSNPSKMPCFSWDIPASLCKTGSILRTLEDTPCSKCYACKGRFRFSNVEKANQLRLQKYHEDADWKLLMSIRLLKQRNDYFRWFSSGDLQSSQMFHDILVVAFITRDYVKHWLPTQERNFVKEYINHIPRNMCVRISSTKINHVQYSNLPGVCNSNISDDFWTCPSHLYENTCGSCRACWDISNKLITYRLH